MSSFITNASEKKLSERLKTLIKNSKELKFLVGFFYFSGVKELYDSLRELEESGKLKDGHMKVLVGLKVDKLAYGLYEVGKGKGNSLDELKGEFLNSMQKAFTSFELELQGGKH
ncbi:hypothetical protein [Thermocrinis sp.]